MRTRSSGPPIEDPFKSAESDIEAENMTFDTENGTDTEGAQAKMGSIKTVFDPKDLNIKKPKRHDLWLTKPKRLFNNSKDQKDLDYTITR